MDINSHEIDKRSLLVYESVLKEVLQMRTSMASASAYWAEELSHFEYMLEAPTTIIKKIRHHTYHLTGLRHYDYRSSQHRSASMFKKKLSELHSLGHKDLFVPESSDLGGFGHLIEGQLVNIDTLKFYEAIIAMERAGFLDFVRNEASPVIAEVGGGWGGLAYQIKNLFPKVSYVIVDFPEVFLFSATYLLTLFPDATSLFVSDDMEITTLDLRQYDFIFIPQHLFSSKWNFAATLAINTVSFQEMTSGQVRSYAEKLSESGAKNLYSLNRDCSPHNYQMTSVSEILREFFTSNEIRILDNSYSYLDAVRTPGLGRRTRTWLRNLREPNAERFRYRHLACVRI